MSRLPEPEVTCGHEDIIMVFEREDKTTMGICDTCYSALERIILRSLFTASVQHYMGEMLDEANRDDE